MGNGAWNDNTYRAAATFRRARGLDDFGYSATQFERPRDQWRADRAVDPFGVHVRESRDSAEHPNSTAIGVLAGCSALSRLSRTGTPNGSSVRSARHWSLGRWNWVAEYPKSSRPLARRKVAVAR